MKTAFIIHGAYGNSEENWFPWLKGQLEKLGWNVFVPNFPTPENQTLENWMKVFEPYFDKINEDTIFIGHSLAPAFILSVLEKVDVKIRSCYFVAGFIGLLDHEIDEINHTITDKDFDWHKIKQNCERFYIFNSDNDEYVSMAKANELANNLDTQVIEVKGAGHFNKNAGYTKFELLLDKIKNI